MLADATCSRIKNPAGYKIVKLAPPLPSAAFKRHMNTAI